MAAARSSALRACWLDAVADSQHRTIFIEHDSFLNNLFTGCRIDLHDEHFFAFIQAKKLGVV